MSSIWRDTPFMAVAPAEGGKTPLSAKQWNDLSIASRKQSFIHPSKIKLKTDSQDKKGFFNV
jgi:hypothetical protein